jgi:hypothetical protein
MCFSKSIYENKIGNLLIEYNDVKLLGSIQYKPRRMLDKNDNVVFIFNKAEGNIAKTDECVIIFDNLCILYFYEVSLEDIRDWYLYSNGGIIQKQLTCKKVIVEIKR